MIIRRVWEVSYELDISNGSKIHNIFHVFPKEGSGTKGYYFIRVASLGWGGASNVNIPKDILEVWERILRRRVIKEYLVQWKDLPLEDATWEGE